MTDYWQRDLKSSKAPQINGTAVLGGDADSSDDISDLIQSTSPDKIVEAGKKCNEIAEMCSNSVEVLHRESGRLAETLGGETLQKVFEKVGELQRDLTRLGFAAKSVGQPLVWYGQEVLPWFQNNVPRTGELGFVTDLDDWVGDDIGHTGTNAHAMARHHLQQLNRFIVEVYQSISPKMEQRTTAPQTGMTDSPLGPQFSMPSMPTGSPYTGSPLTSPYDTPDFGDGPSLTDPSLQDPSLTDPSQKDPTQQDPSLQDPSLQDPAQQDPSLQNPSLQDQTAPDLQNPSLDTPKTPDLSQTPSTTDLSSVPQPTVPSSVPNTTTNLPHSSGPGVTSGTTAATQLGGPTNPLAGGKAGTSGMPMGMMPPMGGQGAGQDRERERTRMALVEDEAFESDDMGGPSVIA
ncbi:hypothetical protein [Nonomuraea insulae]|uniref:Uncharacterized protein n=1 Tax=Nonomuraea insulae TaxID=1616787 RepID=A0ABW1CGS4_9ACTN